MRPIVEKDGGQGKDTFVNLMLHRGDLRAVRTNGQLEAAMARGGDGANAGKTLRFVYSRDASDPRVRRTENSTPYIDLVLGPRHYDRLDEGFPVNVSTKQPNGGFVRVYIHPPSG